MRLLQLRLILRRAGILLLGVMVLLATGCSTRAILASHEPMHPDGRPVTLKAIATGHVDRIEFRVQRFAIDIETDTTTPDRLMVLETQLTPVLFVWACDPLFFVDSLACDYELAFSGDAQLVEFHARAVYWNGSHKDEVYRFASGDFPLEKMPVPIRMKRESSNGIDIVFVPHTDLIPDYDPTGLGFRTHLDDLVDGVLFKYPVIRDYRALFNFWYSPEAVEFNAEDCEELPDPDDIPISLYADVSMYVHYQDGRNCSLDTKLTTELWYDKSVLHELGHALAGLRDEYAVSNNYYKPRDQVPNTFDDETKCRAYAPKVNLSPDHCQLSTPAFNFWRIDPTGADGCMMGPSQHLTWSDFGPACARRFEWRYKQCLEGDCIRSPDVPGPPEATGPEDDESRF